MGIEPTFSAWKADIIATIRRPQRLFGRWRGRWPFHGRSLFRPCERRVVHLRWLGYAVLLWKIGGHRFLIEAIKHYSYENNDPTTDANSYLSRVCIHHNRPPIVANSTKYAIFRPKGGGSSKSKKQRSKLQLKIQTWSR